MSSTTMRLPFEITTDDIEAGSRARELLKSMKKRRQTMSEAVRSSSRSLASNSSGGGARGPVTSASSDIAKQLQQSIAGKRVLLMKMTKQNDASGNTLLHNSSMDNSTSCHTSSKASVGTSSTGASTRDEHSSPDFARIVIVPPGNVDQLLGTSVPSLSSSPDGHHMSEIHGGTASPLEGSEHSEGCEDSYDGFDSLSSGALPRRFPAHKVEWSGIPETVDRHSLVRSISLDEEMLSRNEHPMPMLRSACSFNEGGHAKVKNEQGVMSMQDLEVPIVLMGRTKENEEVSEGVQEDSPKSIIPMDTKQDRACYIGNLYAPSSRLRTANLARDRSFPRRDRQAGRSARRMSGSTHSTDSADVSAIRDPEKRRQLLEKLQRDLENPIDRSRILENLPSPIMSDDEDDLAISDDSSFDFSCASDSSGWDSEEEGPASVLEVEPVAAHMLGCDMTEGLQTLPEEDNEEEEVEMEMIGRAYLAPGDGTKFDCFAAGGLYALSLSTALHSESSSDLQKRTVQVRLEAGSSNGTCGSMYNIALRSEYKVGSSKSATKRQPPTKRASGGLYDMAMKSGLTREEIRSRKPYSVAAKTSRRQTQ